MSAVEEWAKAAPAIEDVIGSYLTLGAMFAAMGKAVADIHVRAWSSVLERSDAGND